MVVKVSSGKRTGSTRHPEQQKLLKAGRKALAQEWPVSGHTLEQVCMETRPPGQQEPLQQGPQIFPNPGTCE